MSNISLLVDCHKIISWLQDRKKLKKDWYTYLKAADQKIKILLKNRDWDIQYNNIHQYISQNQQNFNYIDVSQVVTFLLQTNLAQSNIIFGYNNKIMKEWTNLKKYMESNLLNLLSIAKFIQQSLRFDLPAQNKAIENLDSQLSTLKRKIDYNNNTIFQQTNAIVKEKQLLGIEEDGQNKETIQQLIQILIKKGPEQILKFEKICQSQAIRKYLNIYKIFHQQNNVFINDLKLLSFFIDFGDEFVQVYRDQSQRQIYGKERKYESFFGWKGTNEWQIVIQGSVQQHAKKLDTTTIIEDRSIRIELVNNLNQLLFFFKGIKYELANAGKGLGFETENYKSISIVQGQAKDAIKEIQLALSFLNSKRLIAPLQIKNSKKAYQILVGHFGGYEANIKTMRQQTLSYNKQITDLEIARAKQVQKLHNLRKKIISSKHKCQKLLSDLIQKQVKITGEINKLQ